MTVYTRTGYPATGVISVSVFAKSTELADAKLKEISNTADYLGLNFLDLATSYKSFAASALSTW
mgnify:CR=1 FL=1